MSRCLSRVALVFLLVPGCVSSRRGPFAEWIDREDVEVLAARSLARSPAPAGEPPRASSRQAGPAPEAVALPAEARVEDFVRLAIERNPSLKAAEHRVRRLANRIPQVMSLDDPMLTVSPFGERAETAAGRVGVMTAVSQRLPLPAKLEARGHVAEQDVAEAVRQLERVRVDVVADTRRAWWSFYFATRAIEVTERNRGLVKQFKEIADAKFRAGTVDQEDLLRASVELHDLDNELVGLRQQETSAVAMLNRLVDRPVDAPIPGPPDRTLDEIRLELDAVLQAARRANPALAGLTERIEGFRRREELARLDRWPDLTVSFNYNLVQTDGLSAVANGDDQWWVGFGVNLPIWTERLNAAEREATRGRLENIAALGDEMNRVDFRVQDAFARLEAHQRQVILFRDLIVPEAEQTVDASLSSYRAGRTDFLILIDNWRKLLAFQLLYHQHLAELEQSFADLRRAVGEDVGRQAAPPLGREPDKVNGEPHP